MLVDHHCHLDFPDLAAARAEIMARAAAAGVGVMVTISMRVRDFDTYRAIAEANPAVYFSVGTHPHQAHEELDVGADRLAALSAHPKCVAIGEAGLDYYYKKSPPEAQAAGLRTHIAAARTTGLPLIIHARDADEDMAAILEDETSRGGTFPAVLHCFTGGRRSRAAGVGTRPLHLVLGRHHVQEFGCVARHCGRGTARSRAGGDRRTVFGARAASRQAQRAGVRRAHSRGACQGAGRHTARDRRRNHGKFLPPLFQGAATLVGWRRGMSYKLTLARNRLVGRCATDRK